VARAEESCDEAALAAVTSADVSCDEATRAAVTSAEEVGSREGSVDAVPKSSRSPSMASISAGSTAAARRQREGAGGGHLKHSTESRQKQQRTRRHASPALLHGTPGGVGEGGAEWGAQFTSNPALAFRTRWACEARE